MRIALVTGGSRGLGLETARQLAADHIVYLGVRNLERGMELADAITGDVRAIQLDVTNDGHHWRAIDAIDRAHRRLDALINNAGIHYDAGHKAHEPDFTMVEEALQTNLLGAWKLAVICLPLLERSRTPRIVNVSSGAASMSDLGGGLPAYRVSKLGLNAVTRMMASELRSKDILVNAVCPGWVETDMGGPGGRPVAEGAAGIVWAATLDDDGPTGGFFRDGQPLSW